MTAIRTGMARCVNEQDGIGREMNSQGQLRQPTDDCVGVVSTLQIETLGALSVSAFLIAGGCGIGYHSYLYDRHVQHAMAWCDMCGITVMLYVRVCVRVCLGWVLCAQAPCGHAAFA